MSDVPAKRLIGRVVWGDTMTTAALFDDGTWEATIDGKPIPIITASLMARFADAYRGPQDGRFGRKILHELAAEMDGTLALEDEDYFDDPGVVH
jgi:hypothetical protein